MPIYIGSANNEPARKLLGRFLADRFGQTITIETTHTRLSISIPLIGYIALTQMPGQCGILIAYNLPHPTKIIVEIVETIASIFQYKTVMVSHRVGHNYLSCWLDAGYEPVWENINIHSDNTIIVLARDLGEQPEEFQALTNLIYECA